MENKNYSDEDFARELLSKYSEEELIAMANDPERKKETFSVFDTKETKNFVSSPDFIDESFSRSMIEGWQDFDESKLEENGRKR